MTNPMEQVALSKLALLKVKAYMSKRDLIDTDANLTKEQQDAEGPEFLQIRLRKVRAKLDISLDAVRRVHHAMSDRVVKLQVLLTRLTG